MVKAFLTCEYMKGVEAMGALVIDEKKYARYWESPRG